MAPPSTLKTLKVLYALHPSLEVLDLTGPLEILFHATWTATLSQAEGPARVFAHTITAASAQTTSNQGLTFQRQLPIEEAHATLSSYDVLVIPGGGSPGVLEGQTEPLQLIKAFVALPRKEDGTVRTLMSVCTGSLLLAEVGVLDGLKATTHPSYYGRLSDIAERMGKTEVLKERFVVNKVDEVKELRVITAGGISCGLDASLWLIGEVAGKESKERVAEGVQYAWREGVVL